MPNELHDIRFNTKIQFKTSKVDIAGRTITDVIIAEVGEAQGWGYEIELAFLEAMVKDIKTNMGGRLQSNMNHNYDNQFKQLGRFDDIKLNKSQKRVTGKLTVYKAADKSPSNIGMGVWFLELADEDQEAVMCSINGQASGFYQYDDNGGKCLCIIVGGMVQKKYMRTVPFMLNTNQ